MLQNETNRTPEALDRLVERYEWFTAARALRRRLSGRPDARLDIVAADRRLPADAEAGEELDVAALLRLSSDDIIDRFLQEKDLRIVAEEGEPEEEIVTEASFSEEDDIVSEELAEVYLRQGLKREALAIYKRLSLLNPEKSVYFAEIIGKLETNN